MVRLKKIGHINLRVADVEASKAFYRDVLGFRISEEDPQHGGVFMTLGDDFHTLDLNPHPNPAHAVRPAHGSLGVSHWAFQVDSYGALREAYQALLAHGVAIDHCADHVNQRSIYFSDPDGNRLEIYFEMPDALKRFSGGRHDDDKALPVSQPGEPLPGWLLEDWPAG